MSKVRYGNGPSHERLPRKVVGTRAVGAYAPGHAFFGNQFTGSLGDHDSDVDLSRLPGFKGMDELGKALHFSKMAIGSTLTTVDQGFSGPVSRPDAFMSFAKAHAGAAAYHSAAADKLQPFARQMQGADLGSITGLINAHHTLSALHKHAQAGRKNANLIAAYREAAIQHNHALDHLTGADAPLPTPGTL